MKEFWDQRYSQEEYAYGKQPNKYVEAKLPMFKPGKILFPAEGEGRNAVYAAKLGWEVSAFDFSKEGKQKAEALAKEHQVSIDYQIHSILDENYSAEGFDFVGLIYVHFDSDTRAQMHQLIKKYLKSGGYLLMEVFSQYSGKNQAAISP
ncbi:MAG: methyltransferase domain-containing protein [Marinifilaceae bacterium]|jgi:2-polyprenyl-3-methyl-5-hydroxy-6-metoxy-1,4-benzoquinol methylase|nr:methyltransferase domain-containing protein [Marinifilaceae bacterium]